MRTDRPLYGYFGHHKCASTWFEDICREVCADLGLKFAIVYEAKDCGNDLKAFVSNRNIDFIAFANADYRLVEKLENLKGFHAVRDPRDIVVSAYFSHKNTHATAGWPALVQYREKLNSCSQSEGLFHELKFRADQFDEMRSWLSSDNEKILDLKMEDVTSRPYESMLEIFRHLDLVDEGKYTPYKRIRYLLSKVARKIEFKTGVRLPFRLRRLPAERLLGLVWENDFTKKASGRKVGEESFSSHYRKGQAGDWKNHLEAGHIEYFNEHYGDLLSELGYET